MSELCPSRHPKIPDLRCLLDRGHSGSHATVDHDGRWSAWDAKHDDPAPVQRDEALWWSTYNAALTGLITVTPRHHYVPSEVHRLAILMASGAHGFVPVSVNIPEKEVADEPG